MEIISQSNYSEIMQRQVEPFLDGICEKGTFCRQQDRPIFYRRYIPAESKGAVVISHGFTENGEKFLEMIYYFVKAGFSVYAPDHRGHGYSYRHTNDDYSITHIDSFSDYVDDFIYLCDHLILERPRFLYAHSMGGCIGALTLEKRPDIFEKAVLSSPMLSINTRGLPKSFGLFIAKSEIKRGRDKDRAFIHREFDKNERFEDSPDDCRERYDYFFKKRLANKEFQNNCASYNWVSEALLATKEVLEDENLKQVEAPVLLFSADRDNIVTKKGQKRFVEGIKNGQMVSVDSKHEIYFNNDDVLKMYVGKILEFLSV